MKVVVGSSSDRKIGVVEKVFRNLLKGEIIVTGHSAVSGVPETPYDKQTYDGARNRALDCKAIHQADYYIGLESGLVERYEKLYEEAWACVITKDGKEFYGYSSGLCVPEFVILRMKKQNMEHCDVMTLIEKELGKLPNDTWGTYSGGILAREISLEEALRNALMQAVPNAESLYSKP